jgi:predicted PurR-regulated permease PerM
MQMDDSTLRRLLSRDFMDAAIRIILIAVLVIMCLRVFAPFANLVLWGVILAISFYPLHQRLTKLLSNRHGLASALLVITAILLIGLPTLMLGGSFAGHIHGVYTKFDNNTLSIKQPDPSVAEWPLVGKGLHSAWSSAASNLPAYLGEHRDKLKNIGKKAVTVAANTAGAVLLFLGAMVVGGIMMTFGEGGRQVAQQVFTRFAGPETGPRLLELSTATIRSVANGVIGVAFIQALLLGMGFFMADIPGAGMLALVVMFVGIVQLPAFIISMPAIAYLWWGGDASTTSNIIYTIYLVVAGMADNVLKPFLLGRGVDAPMPVILLGALGGMVTDGIIGMFVGAVLLAVGYQVFMEWVSETGEGVGTGGIESP